MSTSAAQLEGVTPPVRTASWAAPAAAVRRVRATLLLLGLLIVVGGPLRPWWSRPVWRAALAGSPSALALTSLASPPAACDVLVVGATPSGIAAALSAARRGSRVVLVEERARLGGDIVHAMLNMFDIPIKTGVPSLAHGIFAEFFDRLGLGFDIAEAERLFTEALAAEPTLTTHLRTRVQRIHMEGNRVAGATLVTSTAGGPVEWTLAAGTTIDATNDATVAARAGAGYFLGRENAHPDKRMQAAGLLFSVGGVNWSMVRAYVRGKRPLRGAGELPLYTDGLVVDPADAPARDKGSPQTVWLRLGGIHGNYAWERGDIARRYRPAGPDMMCLSINFGRQQDGSVVLNTLNIVGVNGLDSASVASGMRQARAEIPRFVSFLQRAMPGFSQARLQQVADELYIRETRHIHGFYALTAADIQEDRKFFDRVAIVSYPVDLHPYIKGQLNPYRARRHLYTLPLRSLVPRHVDGIFVASRSISATYSAAGSARVIPITMAAGEAAGAAAHLCRERSLTPHQILNDNRHLRALQATLRDFGVDVGDRYPSGSLALLFPPLSSPPGG